MKAAPADIDLADLWRRLGVKVQEDVVLFRDDAPLASIRRAITPGESSLTRRLLGRNGSDLLGEDRRVSGG